MSILCDPETKPCVKTHRGGMICFQDSPPSQKDFGIDRNSQLCFHKPTEKELLTKINCARARARSLS
jgi:hypothetical protein